MIGGYQKAKAQPCTSRGTKVIRCQIFKLLLQTLKSCNFGVALGTKSCFTFFATSSQYLLGARLSWVLQCSKRLPGQAEKLYTRLKTNAHDFVDFPFFIEICGLTRRKWTTKSYFIGFYNYNTRYFIRGQNFKNILEGILNFWNNFICNNKLRKNNKFWSL